jgi:two-component system sensor histidine kinase/response regulator
MNKVKLSFAASAKECLNILANDKHPFVKVITDINMPDVNGLDLANQIAQSYPEVEVFLISAYSKEDLGLASELSKFKYIPKPIDFNELKRVINL